VAVLTVPCKQLGSLVGLTDDCCSNTVEDDALKLVVKFHDVIHELGTV